GTRASRRGFVDRCKRAVRCTPAVGCTAGADRSHPRRLASDVVRSEPARVEQDVTSPCELPERTGVTAGVRMPAACGAPVCADDLVVAGAVRHAEHCMRVAPT